MSQPATKPAMQKPLTQKDLIKKLNELSVEDLEALLAHTKWEQSRHKHQVPPGGLWTVWLMLAGRGAGKTRAAAEWTWWEAYQNPETRWLVCAPTSADIRDTCFEGDSGLISVIPEKLVKEYNRSLSEIILVNGSLIKGISAETPDRLRVGHDYVCASIGQASAYCGDDDTEAEGIDSGFD